MATASTALAAKATGRDASGRPPATRGFEDLKYREVLGHYPTGVVVVSGIDATGQPVGMTIGSFTSVSLDPPLIAFLPTRTSRTFARLRTASSICVNVLAADQESVCRSFATPGARPFDDLGWTPAPGGAPILDDVVAWIECGYHDVTPAGDHVLVLGRVERLRVTRAVQPLLFFQGGYGRFVPSSMMALPEADLIKGVRLAELARPEMDRLARGLEVECSLLSRGGGDLVIVAVSTAPGTSTRAAPGNRVPLRPPLGDLYVAWRGPDEVDAWLSAAGRDRREAYRQRLATARERGWSMAMVGEDADTRLHDLLRENSSGRLTPSRHREIEREIERLSAAYEPVEVVAGRRYDVQSIVAPIFGVDGEVAQVLRLSRLPCDVDGARVEEWTRALTSAAERVTAAYRAAPADADG
ncbi:flavin reductase [Nocardioides sp. cx-173]|uniref:flavin reductase n=1 Tax=Nocardioides sp. cx-173 TaxID=2898796 RepID=UPI001E435BF3|nr:flavin reductase [Nocardioides sp. cx-173]MCD4526592.1 flavin reductase [Nocardioides sp. cx-173]UGB40687.1 flavin reductase [Nocardioides sp. cx-173]